MKPDDGALGDRQIGAVKADGVVGLTNRLRIDSVRDLLGEDGLAEAAEVVASTDPDVALDAITLDLPVPDPAKIFCVCVN